MLLVDDNQAMLDRAANCARACLRRRRSTRDGAAALAAAASLQPDVIVLDISMPGMSGLDVATRLRQAGSTAAIVFFTVHRDPEFVEAAQAAGGIGYVIKARLASDLLQAVCEARAGRRFVSVLQ